MTDFRRGVKYNIIADEVEVESCLLPVWRTAQAGNAPKKWRVLRLWSPGLVESLLFRRSVTTAMRPIRTRGFQHPQDFPFGLKPVIKGALADALFVDLVGAHGNPFVEIFRHRRCVRGWLGATSGSPACRFRFL